VGGCDESCLPSTREVTVTRGSRVTSLRLSDRWSGPRASTRTLPVRQAPVSGADRSLGLGKARVAMDTWTECEL
jgi:hypothetical protein